MTVSRGQPPGSDDGRLTEREEKAMEQEIKELLPTCSHVMNDIRYEGRKIADNGTAEVHLISARSLKRICQLDKSDKDHVFVAEFREAEEFARLMWNFKHTGTIRMATH